MKIQKNNRLNKKLVLIIMLIFIRQLSYSQFNNRTIIEDGIINGTTEIITADIDNDGFQDIIVLQNTLNSDKIGFFINQGDGTYSNKEIMLSIYNPVSVTSGDYNNDGWIDFAVTGGNPNSIVVLSNNMDNTFSDEIVATNPNMFEQVIKLQSYDIDNDNDIDIIAISDLNLIIYYNDGNGSFIKNIVLPGINTEYYTFAVKDINNDGFKDIVVGGIKPLIYMNNDGIINFDSIRTDAIPHNFDLPIMVELNDFNNDGSADLITSGGNSSEIRLYLNDGNGFYTSFNIIQANITRCNSLTSNDFDNDGDNDIFTGFPQTGKVVWYENIGNGTFTSEKVIHTGSIPYTINFISDDLNNDGKIDLIWSQELSVHLNNEALNLEKNEKTFFECYPNPTSNNLFIKSKTDFNLLIFNSVGNLVDEIYIHKGEYNLQLSLSPSIYNFQFISQTGIITKKIIVK